LLHGTLVTSAWLSRRATWTAIASASLLAGALGCDDRDLGAPAGDGPPQLLAPESGAWTGSVWAEASLRPHFRWRQVRGATGYEIQIDDSCSVAWCPFPSPEIAEVVAAPELQPAAPLPVAFEPPVGRRYVWRVRACFDPACASPSPWSAVRYVNVGRQRQDFNGDGYGDLAVGVGSFFVPGTISILFGGPGAATDATATSDPSWRVGGDPDGIHVYRPVWPGDMDGDGYPDLAAGGASAHGVDFVRIYGGGRAPATEPLAEVQDADAIWGLGRAGDVDNDGFDDLVFGRSDVAPTNTVFRGGRPLASGVGREILLAVPAGQSESLLPVGDVDHDGQADLLRVRGRTAAALLVGAGGERPTLAEKPLRLAPPADTMIPVAPIGDAPAGGGVHVLFVGRIPGQNQDARELRVRIAALGATGGDGDGRCDTDLSPASGSPVSDVAVAGVGDVDGDGRDDFVVGNRLADRAHLHFGGCPFDRVLDLPRPPAPPAATATVAELRTGAAVASPGDMDGDGFPEVAVGSTWYGIDSFGGQILLYRGGASVASTPPRIIPDAARAPEGLGLAFD
jgi:hypothetical protein